MTYKNLKKLLDNGTQSENYMAFDLIPSSIRSKVIFIVGNNTSNTGAFLCSIMRECGISYSRYVNSERLELKNRFFRTDRAIELSELCKAADGIVKRTKGCVSGNELIFLLSLCLLDGNDWCLIEMDEAVYTEIIGRLSPHAVIFTSKNEKIIEKYVNSAPVGIKEIILPSLKEIKDCVSSAKAVNGARISYASDCKITPFRASPLGTWFYHFDYLYHIPTIDQRTITHAHLAIEAALALFSPTRPLIYMGLNSAGPTDDFILYSLFPTVLLWQGEQDFELYHKMKYKVISEEHGISRPTEDTVFCGDALFIEKVKKSLK